LVSGSELENVARVYTGKAVIANAPVALVTLASGRIAVTETADSPGSAGRTVIDAAVSECGFSFPAGGLLGAMHVEAQGEHHKLTFALGDLGTAFQAPSIARRWRKAVKS